MSNPELNPFVEANACSTCPSGGFATTTSDNDDLSCCANGCEAGYDPVPNGDASSSVPGTGLRKVVFDWIAGGTLKDAVVAKYGEIENWSTWEVTNLAYVFYGKWSFNADISKWVVSSVTNLAGSTSFLANC